MVYTGEVLFTDEYGKQIVYEDENYRIAVDDAENARYITLWHSEYIRRTDKYSWVKRGVLDAFINRFERIGDRKGKFLGIHSIEIEKAHRGYGYGTKMYRVLIDFAGNDIDGITSYLPNRVNKKQVPNIYKRFGGEMVNDYAFIDFKKYKDRKTSGIIKENRLLNYINFVQMNEQN